MRSLIGCFYLIFLFPHCLCSDANNNLFSLIKLFNFIKDPERKVTIFSKHDISFKFLIDYYGTNPQECLSQVFKLRHIHFESLVFYIISTRYTSFHIPASLTQWEVIISTDMIRGLVKVLILNLFFKPYSSTKEMTKSFSIIEILIKFAQRYIGLSILSKFIEETVSNDIKDWKFAMKFLPNVYLNGTIDYNQFISFLHWLLRTGRNYSLEFKALDSPYYFLFVILLNQIIRRKDLSLFENSYPDLPFLFALILSEINDRGECNVPVATYTNKTYHRCLQGFFGANKRRNSIPVVLNKKMDIIPVARSKLGLGVRYSFPALVEAFGKQFPEPRSKENHNILWQLKGILLVEKKLKIPRNRAKEKEIRRT